MSTKKTNRFETIHDLQAGISEFIVRDKKAAALSLYRKGFEKGEIAKILNVSPSLITKKYKSSFDEIDKEGKHGSV